MERVPHIAGDKYSPDIFAFDPFYAQERLSMAQVLARAQQQVDALSLLSEEETDEVPVWKIVAVLAVSATVALALRRYYVRRRGETRPGKGNTVDPEHPDGRL